MAYDWTQSCAGKHDEKEAFHREARRLLKSLAKDLGFPAGSFDIRSNKGGNAVSGEVVLINDNVRVEASNPGTRHERGLMIRTCKDRTDPSAYAGRNHFAPLSWLEDDARPHLAKLVGQVLEQKVGFNADEKDDAGYNPHYSTPTYSR